MMSHRRPKRRRATVVGLVICLLLTATASALVLRHRQHDSAATAEAPHPKSTFATNGFKIGTVPLAAAEVPLALYKDEQGDTKQFEVTNGALNVYKGGPIKLRPAGTCSTSLSSSNPASKVCVPQIGHTAKVICFDMINGFGVALPMDLVDDSATVQRWLRAKTTEGKDVAIGYIWTEFIRADQAQIYELRFSTDLPNCADIVRE